MELQFPGMAGHSLEGGSISSLKRIMETNSIAEMESCTRALVQQTQDMAQSSAASADHIVSSVQAYISAHYGEQLSLDQLAQQFYLSSSYLSRLFKRETGTTLTTYLQNVRIEAAKNLLRTTALKSYEVASGSALTILCISHAYLRRSPVSNRRITATASKNESSV